MFAVVAILLLKLGVEMKATTMVTDVAQAKNCIKLARAYSVP